MGDRGKGHLIAACMFSACRRRFSGGAYRAMRIAPCLRGKFARRPVPLMGIGNGWRWQETHCCRLCVFACRRRFSGGAYRAMRIAPCLRGQFARRPVPLTGMGNGRPWQGASYCRLYVFACRRRFSSGAYRAMRIAPYHKRRMAKQEGKFFLHLYPHALLCYNTTVARL